MVRPKLRVQARARAAAPRKISFKTRPIDAMRPAMVKKRISVVTPCYNEEENVRELSRRIQAVFADLPQYDYEHILIDNASSDSTAAILREMAAADRRIKVIINTRNFGHIRSPYHGMLQGRGDAVIVMASDLQDPPEMIPQFLAKWEEGYKVVMGVKTQSQESVGMFAVRKLYYGISGRMSNIKLVTNFTGFGLYDQVVIDNVRNMDDPYPYFRGMIADLGYEAAKIPFDQPRRKRGITKNNFFTLYDLAMLGITNYSKVPLRLAAMAGFLLSAVSLVIAFGYLCAKLLFWSQFAIGTAPILIGFFFFMSVQLFFIGMIGEYVGAIHTQVQKRPHVIERERLNFDD
jgi:glycosyltransferase involved in cell wall biosynthesis